MSSNWTKSPETAGIKNEHSNDDEHSHLSNSSHSSSSTSNNQQQATTLKNLNLNQDHGKIHFFLFKNFIE